MQVLFWRTNQDGQRAGGRKSSPNEPKFRMENSRKKKKEKKNHSTGPVSMSLWGKSFESLQ